MGPAATAPFPLVSNITHNPTRRVDVPVGVADSADLDRTREVLVEAAQRIENILDEPDPQVILLQLGDSSVNWQVRVWTQKENYWAVLEATVRSVKQALDEAGLAIPFPQMDVHLIGAAQPVDGLLRRVADSGSALS